MCWSWSGRSRVADLHQARLYLCTDSRRRQGDLVEFLDAVLAAGVDAVQLREKHLEAAEELELAEVFRDACVRHGRLFSVNDRADIALAARADILHVGQRDLPVPVARRVVGTGVLIGRSTHSEDEVLVAARDPDVDYFCVGPTWPTPTKPGRPAPGLPLLRYAASVEPPDAPDATPWFAIGGVDLATLDQVLDAGARRVVVVRAITEADDPAAAAAELARRLAEAATRPGPKTA
jgi:thiamine-phosphate pyrophosphorylase